MYQSNLVGLLDKESKIAFLSTKRKQAKAPRKIFFPELRVHHTNIRGHHLPSLAQLISSHQLHPQLIRKHLVESLPHNNLFQNAYPARDIVLVAKRVGYMDSVSMEPQHNMLKEPERHSRRGPIRPLPQNRSMAQQEYTQQVQSSPKTIEKRISSSMSSRVIEKVDSKKPRMPRTFYYWVPNGGNNQELIRTLLQQRSQWRQLKKGVQAVANFKWLPSIDNFNYKKMSNFNVHRTINHFENHHEITTKNGLIRNLQIYCQSRKVELFSLTPITFLIDFDDQYCQYNMKQFLYFFLRNQKKSKEGNVSPVGNGPTQPNQTQHFKMVTSFIDEFFGYMTWQNSDIRRKCNPLSKPVLYPCYTKEDSYIWLLKPTGLNRGRGIEIFDSLEGLQKILLNYMQLNNRKKSEHREEPSHHSQPPAHMSTHGSSASTNLSASQTVNPETQEECLKPHEPFKMKSCSFVVQKYIQNPLLIDGRKFDIRVWVLLKQDMSLFFFKQGYLRMSSEKYCLDINNYFIHLTNNAVQQHSKQYGNFESGNQLSFDNFKQLLKQWNSPVPFEVIYDRIKELCYISMSSIRAKINPHKRKHCFQIFGYDFILDDSYKVWLIEVNSNPCIQTSSRLLQKLIPRMLNDAFKLTIDELYKEQPSDDPKQNPEREQSPHKSSVFPVDNYQDKQNMWQLLGKLAPNGQYKKSFVQSEIVVSPL